MRALGFVRSPVPPNGPETAEIHWNTARLGRRSTDAPGAGWFLIFHSASRARPFIAETADKKHARLFNEAKEHPKIVFAAGEA